MLNAEMALKISKLPHNYPCSNQKLTKELMIIVDLIFTMAMRGKTNCDFYYDFSLEEEILNYLRNFGYKLSYFDRECVKGDQGVMTVDWSLN